MGREIKFRMWNNVKSDSSKSKYFYDVEAVMECIKQQINFNNGKSVRFENNCYDHVGDGCFFEQFTGLTDRNGKDIYEGDNVRAEISDNISIYGKVSFVNGSFAVADGNKIYYLPNIISIEIL